MKTQTVCADIDKYCHFLGDKGAFMLFKINTDGLSLSAVKSDWHPTELDLETLLVARPGLVARPESKDDPAQILSEAVFGEPLLLVSNQIRTRTGKRADILALDRLGNAVIVELKRDAGQLGVETQALQYLADFSAYRGEAFLHKFASNDAHRGAVLGFLGDEARIEDINRGSRIILVARAFDETLYSLGEWFSSKGVAFRCVTYNPFRAGAERYVSFSVACDRAPESLFRIKFSSTYREPGVYWHNIASVDESWWRYLVDAGQIPACFDDSPGDQGEKLLTSYVPGDVVIAYATGFGAVGWGEVVPGNGYKLLKGGDDGDVLLGKCLHRLAVKWKATAKTLAEAMPADQVRTQFGIYHPIRTSVSVNRENGRRLVEALTERFNSKPAF